MAGPSQSLRIQLSENIHWRDGSHHPSPDGNILARISKVLHQRVNLGLFTIFIKIRVHGGEFLKKKADRCVDEGRDDVGNVRWDGPSSHSTFTWIDASVEHRCSMNKTLRARVDLKVDELQLPFTLRTYI